LQGAGTAEAPILFVGLEDTPGYFNGIRFEDAGSALLDHVVVANGGYGTGYGILKSGSGNLTIRNSTIRNSLFTMNQTGVLVNNQEQIVLTNNWIQENTSYGVNNQNPDVVVDARNSWWDHETGPFHPELNPEGQGNRVGNGVLFDPWSSTGPPPPSGSILGQVATEVTGQASFVAGAIITIVETGTTANSDTDGTYFFEDVPVGTYSLEIRMEGFETIYLHEIDVVEEQQADAPSCDLVFAEPQECIPGDADNDGIVGLADAIYILQVLSGVKKE